MTATINESDTWDCFIRAIDMNLKCLTETREETEMKSCKGKMKDKMPEPKDGMKEGKDEGGNKMKRTKKKGMK